MAKTLPRSWRPWLPKPPSRTAPEARLADPAGLAPLDDSVHAYPGRKVRVDVPSGTVELHVRTTPSTSDDAEPALCVHGLGGSSLNWTELAGVLRGHLAVEALDLPGHGLSGPVPKGAYTPTTHADAVIGLIEASDRGPVHLLANSMGGAIAILVASRRPDLVRTLTLISPAVPDNRLRIYPLKSNPAMALTVLPVLGEQVVKRFNTRYAPEARAKGTIALCFADRSRYPDARFEELVEEVREREQMPWAASAVLRSMRGLATSQFLKGRNGWKTMRTVTAPTLVVWGDTDRLVAPDLAAYVAAAVPDSRLLVMADIGHTAMMEAPVETGRAVLGLLEDAVTTDDTADDTAENTAGDTGATHVAGAADDGATAGGRTA